jgi:hypothetical protein
VRRLDAAILALLIALAPLPARAQDEEKEQPVEYPKEWGPNVAAAARGCKVVESSSTAVGPEAVLDGLVSDGHYWQPDWQKGFPCFFTVSLPRVERIGRVQLTHRPDASFPKEVEVWVGLARDGLRLASKIELPPASIQSFEIEAQDASFVKLVIKSSHQEGQIEVGELALFAPVLGAIRGSDTKDVVEPRQGDRLLGELVTESFVFRSRLGETTVARADVFSITLEDQKDGLDRALLRSGEVIAGEMTTPRLSMKIEGGATIEIPKDKLRAIGLRKAGGASPDFPARPEQLLARGHVLLLADGGRAVGKFMLDPVVLCGPCGEVKIPLASVQSIDLARGPDLLDRIALKGGDVLRGVVVASELGFQPVAANQPVQLPKAVVARALIAAEPEGGAPPPECQSQRVWLRTGEVVAATVAVDRIKVATGYADVEVDLLSVDRIEGVEGGRLRLVLRDGGVVLGRPERDPFPVDIDAGGGRLLVPVDRIERIENFRLPTELAKQVDEQLAKLGDAEFKVREEAQRELAKIGRPALARLAKAAREGSPEARANAMAVIEKIRAGAPVGEEKPAPPH